MVLFEDAKNGGFADAVFGHEFGRVGAGLVGGDELVYLFVAEAAGDVTDWVNRLWQWRRARPRFSSQDALQFLECFLGVR